MIIMPYGWPWPIDTAHKPGRLLAPHRYVLTVFAHRTFLGPAQVAAHMRGKVSMHELTLAGNKHTTAGKIQKASATVINAFSTLDVAGIWGTARPPPRTARRSTHGRTTL